MKLFRPSLAFCAAMLLMTGAATAAVSQQLAGASVAKPAAKVAATASAEAPPAPQNPLQALCREIFINICDEPR